MPDFVNENDREMISISCDKMSFTGGWPRFATILEMILCPSILPRAYCDVFAAVHIILPPDGMTAPAGLDLVSAVRGARGHSVFSGDLIGLAWLHRCTDLVDRCHESESCGLALGAETQGIGARAKRRFKMEICTPLQAAHPGTRISEAGLGHCVSELHKETRKKRNQTTVTVTVQTNGAHCGICYFISGGLLSSRAATHAHLCAFFTPLH